MPGEQNRNKYRANDAEAIVGELFSGKPSMQEALQQLRMRLLDLSTRNRLLNYRHPRGRCLQFLDRPNLNLLFERLLVNSKNILIKPVPEPDPLSCEGKRPEVKQYAERLGIDTSYEFLPSPSGPYHGCRLTGLQALYYPAELERLLRSIASGAKSAIEETGTNVLFLIFGFLEFYESEESDRLLLAPLLSLPVALTRNSIDKETGVYQYAISYNGEDLAENHTLREKLRQDFSLNLPDLEKEDVPEIYFGNIEQTIRTKKRWKVRRQLTLGMLSFGKFAIWADLDPRENPGILQHPLLKMIFEGRTADAGGDFSAEDYKIDERPEANLPLIYDADSSQHSAIIDVLSGKSMVINGPPGTGKSQTITNVIAAALAHGKKVLFVSEKLAVLKVVRHRLNQAGLGHFCLELHSHKTQKKTSSKTYRCAWSRSSIPLTRTSRNQKG